MIPSACTIAADPPSIVIASVFDVALEPELLPDVLELKLEPEPPPQAQSALAAIASSATDKTRTDIGTPVRACQRRLAAATPCGTSAGT
jgi:hypothetical protein